MLLVAAFVGHQSKSCTSMKAQCLANQNMNDDFQFKN